jgi:predicted DNA-binding transcriptional regulator AlpA
MTDRAALLDALLVDPSAAMSLSPAEAIVLLARVGAVEALLRARLAAPMPLAVPAEQARGVPANDRLLTVGQVAERLSMDRRQVYRRANRWPFVRKVGKNLRFSERGLQRWIDSSDDSR